MSYSDRGSKNANSAVIVSVTPDDFDGTDALSGVEFQRRLEEKAFALGNGKIPQQLFGDYCENKKSTGYGTFSSETRGETAFSNLRGLFSDEMEQSFIEGMHSFANIFRNLTGKMQSSPVWRAGRPHRYASAGMRCLRQISEAFIHAEREPDMQEESLLRQWTA